MHLIPRNLVHQQLMGHHGMGDIPDEIIIKTVRDFIQLFKAVLLEIVMKYFSVV